MAAKLTLTKKEADDYLYGHEDTLVNKIYETSRWDSRHELIIKRNGKFWQTFYSQGLTEYQDYGPWEYEDEVLFEEVEPYEVTVTKYRTVQDGN